MKNIKNIKYLFLVTLLLTGTLFSCAQTKSKSGNKKPLIVFVTGDHEYSSEGTMPKIAAELEKNYGFRTKVLFSSPDENSEENIPGLEALKEADMAVFFLRWRRLPADQIKHIEEFLKTGKPVVGFRTTTHAFNYPAGHPLEKWNAFGEMVFNSPPGWGKKGHTHYGHESTTEVSIIPEAAKHPVLTGVAPKFPASSWLYVVKPEYPLPGSESLLMGHPINPNKTDAFDNPVAWVGKNSFGAKFFITTLGHPTDFEQEGLQRLVINAMHWAAGKPVPKKWAGKIPMNVAYHGIRKTK